MKLSDCIEIRVEGVSRPAPSTISGVESPERSASGGPKQERLAGKSPSSPNGQSDID